MKKIATLAFITLAVIGCQKKSNAPASSASPTSAGKVWCVKSYTTYLECNTTSYESAKARATWYTNNGYVNMLVVEKTKCEECY